MGIKAWITVNGNHIPIMDGESKIDAIGRFIKGKRHGADMRMKEMDRELSGDLPWSRGTGEKDIYSDYNEQAKIYKKYGGGKTIKGRAKTEEAMVKEQKKMYKDELEDAKEYYRDYPNTNREMRKNMAENRAYNAVKSMSEIKYSKNKQINKVYRLSDKYKVETARQRRQAQREDIREKLNSANTIYVDGKKFERVKNGKYNFKEYKSGGISWGEDTLINRIINSDNVKYEKRRRK